MIVQAIADFTPNVLKKLENTIAESNTRERSRSRERENSKAAESGNRIKPDRVNSLTSLNLDTNEKSETGQSTYISFFKDDLIKVLADGGNGWWYGHIVEDMESLHNDACIQKGFFPSTFVQQLKSMDIPDEPSQTQSAYLSMQSIILEEPETIYTQDEQVYDPQDIEYSSYAKMFTDRDTLTIQHREQMRHTMKNQAPVETKEDKITKEIINSYKKFGIDNANPTRAIMRRTGANVGQASQLIGRYRDNDQGSKATRQLEHFFDYDAWNDQMNANKPKKSKPNLKKKRNKVFKL